MLFFDQQLTCSGTYNHFNVIPNTKIKLQNLLIKSLKCYKSSVFISLSLNCFSSYFTLRCCSQNLFCSVLFVNFIQAYAMNYIDSITQINYKTYWLFSLNKINGPRNEGNGYHHSLQILKLFLTLQLPKLENLVFIKSKGKPLCNARKYIRSHAFPYVSNICRLLATLFGALLEFLQSRFHCCYFIFQI